LRKTTLDELPNLINVVRGNVSLVGPRPELKEMVRYYRPVELSKFTVKSGITGLAQCTGRNNLTVRQQIAADVRYAETQSLWLDTKILFLTAWSVVRSEGAI
jgi:lipopolysaccharide/colanic/teichoic acid biosynthesis glycosyltransferase